MAISKSSKIVIVDGCRLPFQKLNTGYREFRTYDLARLVLKGVLDRTDLDPAHIDHVIFGCALQDINPGNVAREAALGAGLSPEVTAHSVNMDNLSSHQAITGGIEMIQSGQAEVVIAGGADSISGYPARKLRSLRKPRQLTKNPGNQKGWIGRIRDFGSGVNADSTDSGNTGAEIHPGEKADRLAAMFDIPRETQDAYTVRSHQSAVKAYSDKLKEAGLIPVAAPPNFEPITFDNNIRKESTPENLGILKPGYNKLHGTVTAGNSSLHADGAAAVLLMSEEKAEKLGLTPASFLKSYNYTGQDPQNNLFPGPVYAIPKLLDQNRIKLEDIDVFEFHESYAAEVMAIIKALASEDFAKEFLNKRKEVGKIPMKKLNPMGGSLAFGNPVGATGARLVATAAARLSHEKGKYALVASGSADGLGHAMLLESF